jgi:predicted RNase H-like HicB family nuclease
MNRTIQASISKGANYYVAECLDLPVVTQGKTLHELVTNLHEAIALHLEGEDPSELGLAPGRKNEFTVFVTD